MKNRLLLGALLTVGFTPFISAMQGTALLVMNMRALPAGVSIRNNNDVIITGTAGANGGNLGLNVAGTIKSMVFNFGPEYWIIRDFPDVSGIVQMMLRANGSYTISVNGVGTVGQAEQFDPEEI